MSKALIIVDVQRDFCEGGALAVTGGHATSFNIAREVFHNNDDYATVVHTMDWHNPWPDTNGGHFSEAPDFVNSWPVHCVAGTPGAELHIAQAVYDMEKVFYKGQGKPDYSGFQGVNRYGVGLDEYLTHQEIEEVQVVGIAGDYCVLQTALDAKFLGYETSIIPQLVASVNGEFGTRDALEALKNA